MKKQETKKLIKDVLSSNRRTLLESEAKKLISAWGISTPKSILIKKKKDIKAEAKKLTPPYVLKVVSQDILHKSEAGGVVTDIKNIKELNNVWTKMVKNISHKMPTARIDSFLLEEMSPIGIEVIIGGLRDPQFGPVVMFGTGGILVELMKDVSYRLAPLDKKEALEMIREVKGYPLLTGFRGSKPADIDSLSETIVKLSEILIEIEDIKEIEINPLFVYEKGVKAVDVKAVLNSE
ncbi:MAG: acetate--CoA ligase family protein [Nitrospinae bacterium]|nr:acetate--CoA ligase family protein [Nitrospinota bacterium]